MGAVPLLGSLKSRLKKRGRQSLKVKKHKKGSSSSSVREWRETKEASKQKGKVEKVANGRTDGLEGCCCSGLLVSVGWLYLYNSTYVLNLMYYLYCIHIRSTVGQPTERVEFEEDLHEEVFFLESLASFSKGRKSGPQTNQPKSLSQHTHTQDDQNLLKCNYREFPFKISASASASQLFNGSAKIKWNGKWLFSAFFFIYKKGFLPEGLENVSPVYVRVLFARTHGNHGSKTGADVDAANVIFAFPSLMMC